MIMEYQKIINSLDNTPNQPSKFRTKNWVEITDDSLGTYNTNSQIKFKIKMLNLSLSDYSVAYILKPSQLQQQQVQLKVVLKCR